MGHAIAYHGETNRTTAPALHRRRHYDLRQELLASGLRARAFHGGGEALEDAVLERGHDGVVDIGLATDRQRMAELRMARIIADRCLRHVERQKPQPQPRSIDRQQRAIGQSPLTQTKANRHGSDERFRRKIAGPDLYNTRLVRVRRRENCTKVQIVRQHHRIVELGVYHDREIGSRSLTNLAPVHRLEARI